MGTLGENEINLAKSRAKNHLLRSSLSLCMVLGIDPDDASPEIEIPVPSEDPRYYAYVSLISQLSALEKLT